MALRSDPWLADDEIWAWVSRTLGVGVASVDFETRHLSRVIGLTLRDGDRVVVKVPGWEPRFSSCAAVQRTLAGRGFPCPKPLAGPDRLAGAAVSLEEQLSGGEPPLPGSNVAGLAALLADLVASAGPVERVVDLVGDSPPWVGWDHPGSRLWPDLDDTGRDLNGAPGPAWLDAAAASARAVLLDAHLPLVVGHGDWEAHNIAWRGGAPYAVYDWDSVIAQPEAAIAGAAAAVYTDDGSVGDVATVEETAAFLNVYRRSARSWALGSDRVAWAAGIWVRTFNAKKQAADGGGPQLDALGSDVAVRLRQLAL